MMAFLPFVLKCPLILFQPYMWHRIGPRTIFRISRGNINNPMAMCQEENIGLGLFSWLLRELPHYKSSNFSLRYLLYKTYKSYNNGVMQQHSYKMSGQEGNVILGIREWHKMEELYTWW